MQEIFICLGGLDITLSKECFVLCNCIQFYSSDRSLTKIHKQTKEVEFNINYIKLNFERYNWWEESCII
jgi:hypothetical protein